MSIETIVEVTHQTLAVNQTFTLTLASTGFVVNNYTGTIPDGDKGDIVTSVSSTVWTIDQKAVTYDKFQDIPSGALLGRGDAAAGTMGPVTLGANLSLSALNVLSATGGSVTDGDKGDIVVSGSGAVWTIDSYAVSNAKLANAPALTIKGNDTASTGSPKDISVLEFNQYVYDNIVIDADHNVSGLGSLAFYDVLDLVDASGTDLRFQTTLPVGTLVGSFNDSGSLSVPGFNPPQVITLGDGLSMDSLGALTSKGLYYFHNQPSASSAWVINHNLGSRPNVSVFSVGGVEVFAEVLQASVNQSQILFNNPFSGYAICS
jgi:hypothetical protein